MEDIRVNLEKLNDEEREQLLALIKKAHKPQKVWKPKRGEYYWFVYGNGEISQQMWSETIFDFGYWELDNCFRTKEEAEFYKEKLLVTAELQRFADEHNDEIDWKNQDQSKWFVVFDLDEKKIFSTWKRFFINGAIVFSSKELCEQAIETIGEERIKKYYLGVTE